MQFSEEVSYQDENGQKMTGMPDVVEFSNSDDLEYGENCAYIATYSDSEDYFVSLAEGIRFQTEKHRQRFFGLHQWKTRK